MDVQLDVTKSFPLSRDKISGCVAKTAPPPPPLSPPSPPPQQVVYEVDYAEMPEYQGFEDSRPPRPPVDGFEEKSEKVASTAEDTTSTIFNRSSGGQGGLGGLLKPEVLQRALQAMTAINSVQKFKQFYERYQKCSSAQQNQIVWAAAETLQIRFYKWLERLESVESKLKPAPVQEPVEVVSRWVYAKLPQYSGETLVKVLASKPDSLTVRVPGIGSKQLKPLDVIRVSDYTGD